MPAFARPPVPVVVLQHVQDSAALRHVRTVLVRAPHVKLHQLQRLDERLAAHLDGVAVAGPHGARMCAEALESPGVGEVFAAAASALEAHDAAALERLVVLAGALPEARRGLLSALGWVSAAQLKGIVSPLLAAADPLRRALGLGACRMHHADPGAVLVTALGDADPALRIEALRCASALGRVELLSQVQGAGVGADPAVAFHAAWAACLLGDRAAALEALSAVAQGDSAHAAEACATLLQAADLSRAQAWVRELAKTGRDTPAGLRKLVRACGLLGDPHFVPWLIDLMRDDGVARLAGESFSMITGADLAALDLERKPPEGIEFGPNADPLDQAVALDEDESLPWPEQGQVQAWWRQRAAGMPAGNRFFVGAPPSPEHLARVLREGFQRQRVAAARLRCLHQPGSALFATAAPAWRQQRRVLASTATAA
jgi:uncharacterized protein (TIGR02270 family)